MSETSKTQILDDILENARRVGPVAYVSNMLTMANNCCATGDAEKARHYILCADVAMSAYLVSIGDIRKPAKVFVLNCNNAHGDEFAVCTTEAAAYAHINDYVEERWDRYLNEDMPADKMEARERFFEYCDDRWAIDEVEIEGAAGIILKEKAAQER